MNGAVDYELGWEVEKIVKLTVLITVTFIVEVSVRNLHFAGPVNLIQVFEIIEI